MSTYFRYFIACLTLLWGVSLIIVLLFTFDGQFADNIVQFIIMFGGCLLFSVVFSFYPSVVSERTKITYDNNFDVSKIESIIFTKTKRKTAIENGNKKIYIFNDKIRNWLTNNITLEKTEAGYVLETPCAYRELFAKL